MRFYLSFCLIFLAVYDSALAQISDNFSDGNLTSNPAWSGDVANFTVNAAGQLQLNAAGAATSSITVKGNIPDNATWSLRIKLDFSPSNQNLLKVYLMADRADLNTANAYFLQIGETGSLDAIRLFRQAGATKTELAAGSTGLVANAPVDLTLTVRRTAGGEWSVDATPAGQSLQPQFSVTDVALGGGCSRYFGLQCINTATNKDKFIVDDLDIQVNVADNTPPALLSATADNANEITVVFNEILDSISAVNPAHYTIDKGVGQPQKVTWLPGQNSVKLTLAKPLGNGNFTLQTNSIADCSGNVSGTQNIGFQFFKFDPVAEFDVLVNEIYADISPSAGLPATEWVELYNRSKKIIDLSALFFSDASGSPKALPAYTLEPDSFVVLCATGGVTSLKNITRNVVGVSGFPSLNDSGDTPVLSDAAGNIIDQVPFSVTWHTEEGKKNGGWSLERIDPGKPCIGSENWQSCQDLPGGTPGKANSALNRTPDAQKPRLLSAFPLSSTSLRLNFSEGLDRAAAENIAGYKIAPTIAVSNASMGSDRSVVIVTLASALQPATVYALTAANTVLDCAGNEAITTDTALVGLPEKPAPLDIVINEVMFNPATGGSRYIEVYNRSKKVFSWENFFIANFYDDPDIVEVALQRLLLPGQYDVFTENPDDIAARFSNINQKNVVEQDMPSMDDKNGNVTLYWVKDGVDVTVDSFVYQEAWHNALFNTTQRNGVALERISTEDPTNVSSNWTSASPNRTGAPGTPTLPNSQSLNAGGATADNLVFLPVERLSPDGDGYEDFLEIQYHLPEPGYAATVTIYDSGGIPIRRLGRQELTGIEGFLRWDGESDGGPRVRPGIYVLFAEFFSPNGGVKRTKKAFSVVGKF